MKGSSLIEFPQSEEAYRDWVQANPYGFVINAWKSPQSVPVSAQGMTWHRADCGHIGPDESLKYVTGATIKACSRNPGALAEWAKEQAGPLHYCLSCLDKWLHEQ